MTRFLWFVLAAAAAAGCAGPAHLTERHGSATNAAFSQQALRPPSQPPAVAVTGLDSQEAAIVSEGYRRSLAPKGATVEEPPVLTVQPATQPNRALPPPSVPQGK